MRRAALFFLLILSSWGGGFGLNLLAEPGLKPDTAGAPGATNAATTAPMVFSVNAFETRGDTLLPRDVQAAIFAKYIGTNVTPAQLARAASDLLLEYRNRGYSTVSVAIARERISNGLVIMNVFRARQPQIFISGRAYPVGEPVPGTTATAAAKTGASPRFTVRAYEIRGDTLLSTNTLMSIFVKYTGTNISIAEISKAATEMQMEYRARGYPTVSVAIPQQELKDGIVKIRVFQGSLSQVTVVGNRYFSSNNVMSALPGLHTNQFLNGPVFQAELDRANANPDRQIYPEIQPGPEPNTTELVLKVKDRLPLHAKVEFNNQNSPGTPDLRINTSAVYNNLWQLEHSLGVQYGFSPQEYKTGDQWNFYDLPLVANYSAFYRLPLGGFAPVGDTVANRSQTFGFDEATRQFRLPAPSGRPELNFYASRSTIDTGLELFPPEVIQDTPELKVVRQDVQQDITINEALGFRLTEPLPEFARIRSTLSAGFDFKVYQLTSSKTNNFQFTEITFNPDGSPNPPTISTVQSPVPTTYREVRYAPFSLRWDSTRSDKLGLWDSYLGYSANFLGSVFNYSSGRFANTTGSTQANGYYHILTGAVGRDQLIYDGWRLYLRAEGQWASQPLVSTEQFGIGGVNSVRGYHEGEVFGDLGWRVAAEQKTPPHLVGAINPQTPLIIRGSIFMDYGQVYYLDPLGRPDSIPLWGTGFGAVASVGSHWEARFLCGWPLEGTAYTTRGQPRFNFSLSGQF
jgi:hemolysin activation/secretion protein